MLTRFVDRTISAKFFGQSLLTSAATYIGIETRWLAPSAREVWAAMVPRRCPRLGLVRAFGPAGVDLRFHI
jgi:hypothetical protein